MVYFDKFDRHLDPPEDTRKCVYKCAICGWEIFEGDSYYEIPKLGPCCETCIDEAKQYDAQLEDPDYD